MLVISQDVVKVLEIPTSAVLEVQLEAAVGSALTPKCGGLLVLVLTRAVISG